MCDGDSILWGFTGLEPVSNGNPMQYVLSAGRWPAELSEPERGGEIAVGKQLGAWMEHEWAFKDVKNINGQDSGLFNFFGLGKSLSTCGKVCRGKWVNNVCESIHRMV